MCRREAYSIATGGQITICYEIIMLHRSSNAVVRKLSHSTGISKIPNPT